MSFPKQERLLKAFAGMTFLISIYLWRRTHTPVILNTQRFLHCIYFFFCISYGTCIALRTVHFALDFHVELNLRFCSRSAIMQASVRKATAGQTYACHNMRGRAHQNHFTSSPLTLSPSTTQFSMSVLSNAFFWSVMSQSSNVKSFRRYLSDLPTSKKLTMPCLLQML